MTRAALATPAYRQTLQRIKDSKSPVLYFFWADNLCWLLPYMLDDLSSKNVKVVVRLHRTDLYEYLKSGYAPLRNEIFEAADLLCPVSTNGVEYLCELYPEHSKKIRLSRLGVFFKGTNPQVASTSFTVVSVSFITPVKRVHWIFEALQKLDIPVTWHHFGSGPLRSKLDHLIRSCRRSLSVKLHGETKNDDLMTFYASHHVDVFVNASESEGLPVSIMEALSFGIPVVAPDVGGISELVNSECGILLGPGFNTDDLASAITAISSKTNYEKEMVRKKAQEIYFEKCNADNNYEEFYRMIEGLLKR
jgi:colanic acid/amylovoran biosynthesis glycosyltransferase